MRLTVIPLTSSDEILELLYRGYGAIEISTPLQAKRI
jgi:hypothetical protein